MGTKNDKYNSEITDIFNEIENIKKTLNSMIEANAESDREFERFLEIAERHKEHRKNSESREKIEESYPMLIAGNDDSFKMIIDSVTVDKYSRPTVIGTVASGEVSFGDYLDIYHNYELEYSREFIEDLQKFDGEILCDALFAKKGDKIQLSFSRRDYSEGDLLLKSSSKMGISTEELTADQIRFLWNLAKFFHMTNNNIG